MKLKECYQRLELPTTATASEIRQAYKKLVKNWHPDRFEADSSMKVYAEERLKIINVAYDRIRKHQAIVGTNSTTAEETGQEHPIPKTTSTDDFLHKIRGISGQLFYLSKRMLGSFENIFYSPDSSDACSSGTRKTSERKENFQKPFKRILKDLKNNHPHDIIGERKKRKGFKSVYSLRNNYGPRRRSAAGPITGVAPSERNQVIDTVNRITPIRRVE